MVMALLAGSLVLLLRHIRARSSQRSERRSPVSFLLGVVRRRLDRGRRPRARRLAVRRLHAQRPARRIGACRSSARSSAWLRRGSPAARRPFRPALCRLRAETGRAGPSRARRDADRRRLYADRARRRDPAERLGFTDVPPDPGGVLDSTGVGLVRPGRRGRPRQREPTERRDRAGSDHAPRRERSLCLASLVRRRPGARCSASSGSRGVRASRLARRCSARSSSGACPSSSFSRRRR